MQKSCKRQRQRLEKAVADSLGANRVARLHQIERHQRGLPAPFAARQVQKDLGLTEEQLAQMGNIIDDNAKTRRLLTTVTTAELGRTLNDDSSKTVDRLKEVLNRKLTTVLTAEQRDKLNTMLGEPFKVTTRPRIGVPGDQGGPRGRTGNPVPPADQ